MAHRIGICTTCRARFQIPANFSPNRARCRTCGGVVEVGPLQTSESPAAANPATAPRGAPDSARLPLSPSPAAPAAPASAPAASPARPASRPAARPEPVRVAAPAPAPRKSRLVPVLLVVVAVVAVGLGVWALLGSGEPKESQAAPAPTGVKRETPAAGDIQPPSPPDEKKEEDSSKGH